MRKTMIALMVGLAVLVAFGPRDSMAGTNVSFGFSFGPPVVYDPYYVPPPAVYNPYMPGFGFFFGPGHQKHHPHWGHHPGKHHGHHPGKHHGPPVHKGGW